MLNPDGVVAQQRWETLEEKAKELNRVYLERVVENGRFHYSVLQVEASPDYQPIEDPQWGLQVAFHIEGLSPEQAQQLVDRVLSLVEHIDTCTTECKLEEA